MLNHLKEQIGIPHLKGASDYTGHQQMKVPVGNFIFHLFHIHTILSIYRVNKELLLPLHSKMTNAFDKLKTLQNMF